MNVVSLPIQEGGARWDAWVGPRTMTVTDLWAWRLIVRDAYGMGSHFLCVERGGQIAGSLGLFEVKHAIFGHYLTTAPFGNDGGLHAPDDEARDALLTEARALADRLGVAYLVIRCRERELPGFRVDSHYRSALLDLPDGSEALWSRLPAKTRNQVRRGIKEGFSFDAGPDQMDAFLDVFHAHMRDLGSPAHSRRYYEAICSRLPGNAEFLIVRDGARGAAGALLLWTNGIAMNIHTVSLREFNKRCPNYLVYWRMMERSIERGCRQLDMGRSEVGSGNLDFKFNWEPREIVLTQNYYLRTIPEPPYLDPRNPKYAVAIAAWRRMPVWLTRRIGPRLIGGLA